MTPAPAAAPAPVAPPPPRPAKPAAAAPAHPFVDGLHGAHAATSRRDTLHRRSLVNADLLGLVLAYALVMEIFPLHGIISGRLWMIASLPLWVVLNKALRLYDRDANLIHKSTLDELPSIAHSVLLGTGLLYLVAPLAPGVEVGRTQAICFALLAIVTVSSLRWCARALVHRLTSAENVLIVGSGPVAGLIERKLADHPEYGARLVGHVDGDDIAEFEATCRVLGVERVVVTFSSNLSHERMLDVVRVSRALALKVSIVPRLFEAFGPSVDIDQVEGMTLLGLRSLRPTRSTLLLKRGLDVAFSAIGLALLAPAFALIALAVRLDSPGPVLFCQPRVGRRNAPFTMLKFRTMVDGADALKAELAHLNEVNDGVMFKIANDPRITRVGRFLRRTSLDELPQLFNVLRGEMSLVGPRPLVPDESDHLLGWHRARLDIAPGLTGPWQVLGRTAIPFEEMAKLDCLYVTEWSLWNDAKLVLRTLPVVMARRGL